MVDHRFLSADAQLKPGSLEYKLRFESGDGHGHGGGHGDGDRGGRQRHHD